MTQNTNAVAAETAGPVLQRQCACGQHAQGGVCDSCKKGMARGNRPGVDMASAAPRIVHRALDSPGETLEKRVRLPLESLFGQDFSNVRVHTDAAAADSARAIGALAYTVGPHVVFGAGQYAPRTAEGRRTLMHELTHVAQQRHLPNGTPQALHIGSPGDEYERQADRFAQSAGAIAERPLPLRGAFVQRLDPFTKFQRFFGISAGTITDAELTEYLDRVTTNRKCDCGFLDFLSDDMARELINRWGVGKYNLDQNYKGVSSTEIKRILIQELLSGPTGGDDERAIIKVFQKSSAPQIKEILDPTQGVSIQDLLDNVSGDNQKELLHLLETKLPDIGTPHLTRSERPDAKSGACTVSRALKINFAVQTAERLVQMSIDMLDQFASKPVENKNVERLINCYFKGASPGQIGNIRKNFQLIKDALSRIFFVCPAEPFVEFRVTYPGGSVVYQPEEGLQARSLVQKEPEAKPPAAGTTKSAKPQPAPEEGKLNVLLFPDFFDADPNQQARIAIHEAFHHATKQGDVKEDYNVKCGETPLDFALTNAQSYAMFAAQLAQSGLHTTWEDCPAAWKSEIVAATRTAEIWTRNAVAKLDGVITNPQSADSRMRANLKRHFRAAPDEKEVVRKIRDTLAEIQNAFGGEIPFECEMECTPDVPGYTGGLLGIFPRGGNIHLCRYWFEGLNHSERAETILHEMAHRYGGKWGFDEVYMKDPRTAHRYLAQSTEDALGNADSFAQFARTLPEPASDTEPAEPEKESNP